MGKLIPQTEPIPIASELVAYAEHWRQALGLTEWKIWLNEDDAPNDDRNNAGICEVSTRYMRATVTILRTLTLERKRETILHELLHVVLAWYSRAIDYAIGLIPEERESDRELVRMMRADAEEQTIERLVRSLPMPE
jgi:hypothetical protein